MKCSTYTGCLIVQVTAHSFCVRAPTAHSIYHIIQSLSRAGYIKEVAGPFIELKCPDHSHSFQSMRSFQSMIKCRPFFSKFHSNRKSAFHTAPKSVPHFVSNLVNRPKNLMPDSDTLTDHYMRKSNQQHGPLSKHKKVPTQHTRNNRAIAER